VSRVYDKAYVRRDGERVELVIVIYLLELEPLRVFAICAPRDDAAGRAIVDALAAVA
jgi:hypothetical protein